MTKALILTEKNTTHKRRQNFDYMTAVQLRTVIQSNDSNPVGVVKPVNGMPTLPLTTKTVQSKGHAFKNL